MLKITESPNASWVRNRAEQTKNATRRRDLAVGITQDGVLIDVGHLSPSSLGRHYVAWWSTLDGSVRDVSLSDPVVSQMADVSEEQWLRWDGVRRCEAAAWNHMPDEVVRLVQLAVAHRGDRDLLLSALTILSGSAGGEP